MAQTTTPDNPVLPKYKFKQDITVTGTNVDGTVPLPVKTFKTGDTIDGFCRKGHYSDSTGPARTPALEYSEGNAIYLIDAKNLDPLVPTDVCGYDNLPPKPIIIDETTKKILVVVAIIVGAAILLKIFKVIK